jgi:hypothetical protein
MEQKTITTNMSTLGEAQNEAFDIKYHRTKLVAHPRCPKCSSWGNHHRPQCEDATRDDALHHMDEAKKSEQWARDKAEQWLQACRQMHGKLAMLKHENNQLRKKVTAERNVLSLVNNWDVTIDKARTNLHEQSAAVWELTNKSDQHKITIHSFLNDQSNDLEVARRVFNHYIETGLIVYPE